uniref:Uncharacterized protein n=1 Tax=Vespula pensylvanica TaxID=30213 RepID=A0A834UGZ5_VESPE|nr:hypothetical protein H0235_001099 [Vespula pensylvanica]
MISIEVIIETPSGEYYTQTQRVLDKCTNGILYIIQEDRMRRLNYFYDMLHVVDGETQMNLVVNNQYIESINLDQLSLEYMDLRSNYLRRSTAYSSHQNLLNKCTLLTFTQLLRKYNKSTVKNSISKRIVFIFIKFYEIKLSDKSNIKKQKYLLRHIRMMFMEYKINFSIGIAGRILVQAISTSCYIRDNGKPKDTVNAIRKIKKNKDDALLLYEHNYKETSMKFPRWKNKELDIENIDNRIWLT